MITFKSRNERYREASDLEDLRKGWAFQTKDRADIWVQSVESRMRSPIAQGAV